MKKLLTLKNILKAAGAVLGLVAFFMMFAKQLWVGNKSLKVIYGYDFALFDKDFGSWISFVGYLLGLLAAVGLCASIFLKGNKLLTLVLAGAVLLGAILIFIEAAVVNGRADVSAYHLAAGPVLAGIFALLAGLLGAASEFVK